MRSERSKAQRRGYNRVYWERYWKDASEVEREALREKMRVRRKLFKDGQDEARDIDNVFVVKRDDGGST